MPERRHARYVVDYLNGRYIHPANAHILNISLTGMSIESPLKVNVNRPLTMNVKNGTVIDRLSGSVVWCRLSRIMTNTNRENMPVYQTGVRFRNVFSGKGYLLHKFIETNADSVEHERLCKRFPIHGAEDIVIEYERDFMVKTISLSGMLVLTDFIPEIDAISTVKIDLDDYTLKTDVRTAYVNQSVGKEGEISCRVGLEFVSMKETDRRILDHYLSRHGRQ